MAMGHPLVNFDAQQRLRELEERWVDEFLALCDLPARPEHDQARIGCIERLNAIEDEEAEVKAVLP